MTELKKILKKADDAKRKWRAKHPIEPGLLAALQEKLRAVWTYHSNSLEGNTLDLGETIFFLKEGLTSEGKPLKDYLEAKNHAEAIDYLYDVVKGGRELTTGLIKEFNALLLKGIDSTAALGAQGQKIRKPAHPGEYKQAPNHVLTLSGKIHHYVEPLQVAAEMDGLLSEYHEGLQKNRHPILLAADLHYGLVRIHPFDDGNGRVARLVMSLILIKNEYPPAIIPVEKRRTYLKALEDADAGQQGAFYQLVAESVLDVLEMCLQEVG